MVNESLKELRKTNSFLNLTGNMEEHDLAGETDILSVIDAKEIFLNDNAITCRLQNGFQSLHHGRDDT